MNNQAITKKLNPASIAAIVLLIIILLGSVGLIWLYKIERAVALKSSATNQATTAASDTSAPSSSFTTSFYEKIKALYKSYENQRKSTPKKSAGKATTSQGSTSNGESAADESGIGGVGQSGVLDTDVPWREEGEPDLDYSYKEVRACGALIKGPPEISGDSEQFDREYQEYLTWIDTDCRAAYAEAGKDYPF